MIKPINNDFNLFKNFYYVAMTGSFSKAAKELYISQPTVSYNVKCLEQSLGTQLLYRKPKGVELTADGTAVLQHIETAYNAILLAERSLTDNRFLNAGTLNIGGPSYIMNKFISPIICSFAKKYPKLKINLITKSSSELLVLLKTNRIDLLIDTLPFADISEEIVIKNLWQKETCFAGKKELVEKYNPKEQMLLFPERRSDIGKYLLQEFLVESWTPNIKMEITSTEIMHELCLNGVGIGYFMRDYIEKDLENKSLCVLNDLNINMPTIKIACLYIKKFLNHAATEFLKTLQGYAGEV